MARKFIIVLSLILPMVSFGQIHDSTWTKEVGLSGSNHIKPKKRVLLLESDTFAVYSTFNLVIKNIKSFIKEHDVIED
jgi:hypothetical protein